MKSTIKVGQRFSPIGPMRVLDTEMRDGEQWINVEFELWDEGLKKNRRGTCWCPGSEFTQDAPDTSVN